MKKIFFITTIFVFSFALLPNFSFAQGMMGNNMTGGVDTVTQNDNGHTASGEAEGEAIQEKLQMQELNCGNLSDDDFHSLGMYFMGLMAGDSHEAMDTMMEKMMGEEGEEQMHIAMGKRMSDCEPDAPMPQSMTNGGMMPMMMNMMMGGGMMGSGNNSMIGNFAANPTSWFGWGLGWIFMILFWGLVILAIVALIKWIMNQGRHATNGKSALEILKERYAESEIDRKEFEEKKKDLS